MRRDRRPTGQAVFFLSEQQEVSVRAIIVAGGDPGKVEDWQKWIRDGDLTIGADGGAARMLDWDLVPDAVVGDLDSLPDEARAEREARGSRFVVHPRAKDETDLELALTWAVEEGADEIIVLGALGGRLDHLVANVLLLTLPALEGVAVSIVSGGQTARVLRGGETVRLDGRPGDVVSLLPLGGPARGVTTVGLAWPLEGETLRFGFSRGVSNEMTGSTAHVSVDDGYLLAVHGSPDMESE